MHSVGAQPFAEHGAVKELCCKWRGAVCAAGFRAVPLKNNYSENLELASLLVKIDIFPSKVRGPCCTHPAAGSCGVLASAPIQSLGSGPLGRALGDK